FSSYVEPIAVQPAESVLGAAGPGDFNTLDLRVRSDPKMQAPIGRRGVTRSKPAFGKLGHAARGGAHLRPSPITIASTSGQHDRQPMVSIRADIAEQVCPVIAVYTEDVDAAVVIVVSDRKPPSRAGSLQGAGDGGSVRESPAARIAVEPTWLLVARIGDIGRYARMHVAVRGHEIRPSVAIHIDERRPPTAVVQCCGCQTDK